MEHQICQLLKRLTNLYPSYRYCNDGMVTKTFQLYDISTFQQYNKTKYICLYD